MTDSKQDVAKHGSAQAEPTGRPDCAFDDAIARYDATTNGSGDGVYVAVVQGRRRGHWSVWGVQKAVPWTWPRAKPWSHATASVACNRGTSHEQ